jgi:hypothetical protein
MLLILDDIKGKTMENTSPIEEKEINYDVFNALNLHNPMLGEAYAKFDWNPLGDDFSLDLPFIEKYLDNAKYKYDEKKVDFIEKDPKAVHETFLLAAKRNKQLIDELKTKLESGEFSDYKGADITPQVKDIMFHLECRQKMLEISIGQLKGKRIDALTAYRNVNGINKKLSQLLEEAYQKEFNQKVILENILLYAQQLNQNYNPQLTHTDIYAELLTGFQQMMQDTKTPEMETPILDFVNKQLEKLNDTLTQESADFKLSEPTSQPDLNFEPTKKPSHPTNSRDRNF